MFCRNCGQELSADQSICAFCGVPKGSGNKHCPNCGNETAQEAVVCVNCGASLGKQPNPADSQYLGGKDKIMVALLAFFFGSIGIHNFVLGETKKGIIKIVLSVCCCGLGSVFALVDFILVLCDKYVVDPNKLLF